MSTNAPTSRLITYMHCHVDEVSLEVIFYLIFFQRNISIGSFLFFFQKKNISFPLFFKLHFIFLLALHFESSSNSFSFLLYTFNPLPICHPYIHFFLYKGDNSWETWLELFQSPLLIICWWQDWRWALRHCSLVKCLKQPGSEHTASTEFSLTTMRRAFIRVCKQKFENFQWAETFPNFKEKCN